MNCYTTPPQTPPRARGGAGEGLFLKLELNFDYRNIYNNI